MRRRNYCLTINNPTKEDTESLSSVECRYLIFGDEVGKNDTPHYQCYIEFEKSMRFNAVSVLFPRAHIEGRKGTRVQARDYCKKDGKFTERGEFVDNGARTDLEEIQVLLDSGVNMKSIYTEHFSAAIRYGKAFERYKILTTPVGIRDVEVSVYWGESGTGKTYKAVTENPDCYILTLGNTGIWFDGYYGQSCLIIDDFDGWINFRLLLRILDVYSINLDKKGSQVPGEWTNVIITSNIAPNSWYMDYDFAPLGRRLHNVLEFKKKGLPSLQE